MPPAREEGTTGYRVSESELRRASSAVLEAAGLSAAHAATVAQGLVQAELRGQGSHGVSRLLDIYVERLQKRAVNPKPQMRVERQKGSTAVVDGDNGPGQVVGRYAMDVALDLAAAQGSGWVGVHHSTHYGAAAFYLQPATERGCIGVTTTNAPPNMPPWGGRQAYLGTNPLAIAIPTGEYGPIVLDMATSVVAKGKIQLMAKEGRETIPENWALDAKGRPTQAIAAVLEGGMMLPVGGPKGYGLALAVEVLSALLSGADFGPHLGNMYRDFDRPQNIGHFFGALQIEAFLPLETFLNRIDTLVYEMKGIPRMDGIDEILLPGEIERRCEVRYREEGIPIDPDVYDEIARIAAQFDVTPPATKS